MMNPLQGLYGLGLKLDRLLTPRKKLPHPVISVGNIAVGGRAKTPFVIALCKYLKSSGKEPVVLTRGYGRKSKIAKWLVPERGFEITGLGVDECGDEALETFLLADVPVLVSPDRFAEGMKYAAERPSAKPVFVLDDGFQHWTLFRDMDLVIVSHRDEQDSLLPTGRLRESLSALKRADLILSYEHDLEKKLSFSLGARGLDPSVCVAVTTRAGDQGEYQKQLSRLLGFELRLLAWEDHLSADILKQRLAQLDRGVSDLVLGFKEAVKLLPLHELTSPMGSFSTLSVGSRKFRVFLARMELKFNESKVHQVLKRKGLLP